MLECIKWIKVRISWWIPKLQVMDSSASQSFDHSTVPFSILVGSSEIKFQFFLKRRASFFLRLQCSSVNKPNILQQCFYEIVQQGKVRRTVYKFISRTNEVAFFIHYFLLHYFLIEFQKTNIYEIYLELWGEKVRQVLAKLHLLTSMMVLTLITNENGGEEQQYNRNQLKENS